MGPYRQPCYTLHATPIAPNLTERRVSYRAGLVNEATLINQTHTKLSCLHYYNHAYSALNAPLESDWMEKLTEGGTDTGGTLAGYPVPPAGGPPAVDGG